MTTSSSSAPSASSMMEQAFGSVLSDAEGKLEKEMGWMSALGGGGWLGALFTGLGTAASNSTISDISGGQVSGNSNAGTNIAAGGRLLESLMGGGSGGGSPPTNSWNNNVANLFPGWRDVQQQTAQTDQIRANTAQLKMRTAMEAVQMQRDLQLQQMMQGVARKAGQASSAADIIQAQADAAIKAGFTDEGSKLLERAALIKSHAHEGERLVEQARHNRELENEKRQYEADDVLAGVHSQDDLGRATLEWEATHGTPAPWSEHIRQYDPKLFDQIRAGTKAGRAQTEEARKVRKDELDEKNKEAELKIKQSRLELARKQMEIRERQRAAATKAGLTSDPGTKTLTRVEQELKKAYPDLPAEEMEQAAYDIAQAARTSVQLQRGLSLDDAIQVAIRERKDDFDKVKGGFFHSDRTIYQKSGVDTRDQSRMARGTIKTAQSVDYKGYRFPDQKSLDAYLKALEDAGIEEEE